MDELQETLALKAARLLDEAYTDIQIVTDTISGDLRKQCHAMKVRERLYALKILVEISTDEAEASK